MKEAHKNKELSFLTVANATALIGKEIVTLYFGYNGQDGIDKFVIGEIISKYEFYKRDTTAKGFSNRTEYWESYMSKAEIDERKRTMLLITNDGRNTYIKAHDGKNFTCSDEDRYVLFMMSDEN